MQQFRAYLQEFNWPFTAKSTWTEYLHRIRLKSVFARVGQIIDVLDIISEQ